MPPITTQYALHIKRRETLKSVTHRAYGPYALCVTLFNVSRRLILRAYCVEIGGIPAHSEGILVGHEVAKSQVVNQTRTTSLTELHLDLVTYPLSTFSKLTESVRIGR